MPDSNLVVGVDGARVAKHQGWVYVSLEGGRVHAAGFHESFAELLEEHAAAEIVAVDIPIGLVASGRRAADEEARGILKGQASSVFSAPPRAVLLATDYEEACALSLEHTGRKISRQTWGLVPRIREVDLWKEDRRILEVHPELSFRHLSARPLGHGKKTWRGQTIRRRLLEGAGIVLPDDLATANSVPPDDVLDAAIASWTALRAARGEAIRIPQTSEQLDGSRPIAIWA
jgi:predicted RNase H-like nuclease